MTNGQMQMDRCLLAEQPGIYDFTVVNDNLDKAYESLKNYLEKVCICMVFHAVVLRHCPK